MVTHQDVYQEDAEAVAVGAREGVKRSRSCWQVKEGMARWMEQGDRGDWLLSFHIISRKHTRKVVARQSCLLATRLLTDPAALQTPLLFIK